ncbi:hypothetical protein EDB19DRAFT_1984362 [Suillus lakei]|nr:hypothetical protein EDB19DRAFT_1984362 [Suillus lakei]
MSLQVRIGHIYSPTAGKDSRYVQATKSTNEGDLTVWPMIQPLTFQQKVAELGGNIVFMDPGAPLMDHCASLTGGASLHECNAHLRVYQEWAKFIRTLKEICSRLAEEPEKKNRYYCRMPILIILVLLILQPPRNHKKLLLDKSGWHGRVAARPQTYTELCEQTVRPSSLGDTDEEDSGSDDEINIPVMTPRQLKRACERRCLERLVLKDLDLDIDYRTRAPSRQRPHSKRATNAKLKSNPSRCHVQRSPLSYLLSTLRFDANHHPFSPPDQEASYWMSMMFDSQARNAKVDRDFHHKWTGALLCPAGLNWSNSETKAKLKSGEIIVTGDQWPLFLYADYHYDPEDPWNGQQIKGNSFSEGWAFLEGWNKGTAYCGQHIVGNNSAVGGYSVG